MKRNWNDLYDTYKINYRKAYMKNEGQIAKMYDKRTFIGMYSGLEADRQEEVSKGGRKVLNIQQDLVRKQTYQYSSAQAKAFQTALMEEGIAMSQRDIRRGIRGSAFNAIKDKLFSSINKTYNDLRASGATGDAASWYIGMIYFGSE